MSKTELALEIAKIENKVYGFSLPQLRMQALQMTKTSIGTQSVHYDFATADKFVHYFLTGEHQLPGKKE